MDVRGQGRTGVLTEFDQDTRSRPEYERKVAPDGAQTESLTGDIAERRLFRGKKRRQRPVGRFGLMGGVR
jgi:hypothetical protein